MRAKNIAHLLAAFAISLAGASAGAHERQLPGLGGPRLNSPICDAESLLAPTLPPTDISPKAKKLKEVADRLSQILREIYSGETKYSRWIDGLWNENFKTVMEMWGITSPKKYSQIGADVNELAYSQLFFAVRDSINDSRQLLLQIHAGKVDTDSAARDPLLGENKLAYQILTLYGAVRRSLRNSPEVRRRWQQRVNARLQLPADQRPDESADTMDFRTWVNANARTFRSVPGAPPIVSAARGLADHSFIHYAFGLVGFENPEVFAEFFVREKPNWVVRGHLDINTVLAIFLAELNQQESRIRLSTQQAARAVHSDQYRKFEFAYQFPGYSRPHKFQAVICWNPDGCRDRDGNTFKYGDLVTLYPRCGPDVYLAPERLVFQSQLKSGMLDQGVNEKYIEHCK